MDPIVTAILRSEKELELLREKRRRPGNEDVAPTPLRTRRTQRRPEHMPLCNAQPCEAPAEA